ncbi:hypothetical protein DsansV1_C18g0149041 [Dioscorea sansibarensis]
MLDPVGLPLRTGHQVICGSLCLHCHQGSATARKPNGRFLDEGMYGGRKHSPVLPSCVPLDSGFRRTLPIQRTTKMCKTCHAIHEVVAFEHVIAIDVVISAFSRLLTWNAFLIT